MNNDKNTWKQFAETGSVYAYLQYRGINLNSGENPGGEQNVGVFDGRTGNKNNRYR